MVVSGRITSHTANVSWHMWSVMEISLEQICGPDCRATLRRLRNCWKARLWPIVEAGSSCWTTWTGTMAKTWKKNWTSLATTSRVHAGLLLTPSQHPGEVEARGPRNDRQRQFLRLDDDQTFTLGRRLAFSDPQCYEPVVGTASSAACDDQVVSSAVARLSGPAIVRAPRRRSLGRKTSLDLCCCAGDGGL